ELYKPLDARILITDVYTAEMIKYASNAFLATRISFINEVARIAERVDADIKVVAEGMGLDRRIGPQFLDAGLGYGGSCLTRDGIKLAEHLTEQDWLPLGQLSPPAAETAPFAVLDGLAAAGLLRADVIVRPPVGVLQAGAARSLRPTLPLTRSFDVVRCGAL